MAKKNNSLRENFYKSEILSYLNSKLNNTDFNNFVTLFNNFITKKETEISELNSDINSLQLKINSNTALANILNTTKADTDNVLKKNKDGTYSIPTSLACNKYTFLEDTTSCIKKLEGEDGLAIIINNNDIIYIRPDGIYLPYLSTKEGYLMVIGQQGKVSTIDTKLKLEDGVLKYHNGSTWVTLT